MKALFAVIIGLFLGGGIAFADGSLDLAMTGTNHLNAPLQILSPKPGAGGKYTLTGNAYQYMDVSKIKLLRLQGVTSAGAAAPISIYFTTASNTGDVVRPFTVLSANGENFGIAAGVNRMYFRNFSTASPPTGTTVRILAR